jgi:hypothetical protein
MANGFISHAYFGYLSSILKTMSKNLFQLTVLNSLTIVKGNLKRRRKNKPCYICKKKDGAICLTCDYRDCNKWFHIRCGIDNKILRNGEALKD